MIDRSKLFRSVNYQTVEPVPTTDNPDSRPPACGSLLIIGASARQYAESADRAGIVCSTVDLFSDWDLQQFAHSYFVDSLDDFDPSGFFGLLADWPDRFVICGGMEKRPQLVSEISQHLPYVGVCPNQLERLNNPIEIANRCAAQQISFPLVRLPGNPTGATVADCLLKPRKSAGGTGIVRSPKRSQPRKDLMGRTPNGTGCKLTDDLELLALDRDYYHQEFVAGQSYSSLFCSDTIATKLIGSTIQLVGLPEFSGHPFSYCGSIGPVDVGHECQCELDRIGNELAREFQLVGIFGIDWILDLSGKIWLIEINPRMTASAEIFELAGCVPSIMRLHLDSAAGGGPFAFADHQLLFGKAILFSDSTKSFTVNQNVFDYFCGLETLNGRRSVADIPKIGTRIGCGEPILTLFASGKRESELLSRLQSKAELIRREIATLQDRSISS